MKQFFSTLLVLGSLMSCTETMIEYVEPVSACHELNAYQKTPSEEAIELLPGDWEMISICNNGTEAIGEEYQSVHFTLNEPDMIYFEQYQTYRSVDPERYARVVLASGDTLDNVWRTNWALFPEHSETPLRFSTHFTGIGYVHFPHRDTMIMERWGGAAYTAVRK